MIERPREGGADAVARLADGVAARYGIPAGTLRERLAAGRLRVKSNVDRATADTFAADLESLGAIVAILDTATGEPVPRRTAAAPAKPITPPAPAKPATPLAPAKPATPAPAPAAKSAPVLSSGLSAAFGSNAARQDLGALESGDFALSTLDGADDSGVAAPAISAPAPAPARNDALPASFGPAAEIARDSAAVDPFAPPDSIEDDQLLDLDVEPRERRTGRLAEPLPAPAATAAPSTSRPGTPAPARAATPTPLPGPGGSGTHAPAPARSPLAIVAGDARVRFGAGLLVAILLGFVPAHLVAAARESSADERIDREIHQRFRAVISDADYRALDPMLARETERKRGDHRAIALQSMLIWALGGAAIAYVWFRRIDWDALA